MPVASCRKRCSLVVMSMSRALLPPELAGCEQVGFGSSVIGVGATNGLGKVRQLLDPEATSPNPPPECAGRQRSLRRLHGSLLQPALPGAP